MPLAPGTRLGSYEIVAAIGAGGMGEVYRAHDARLRRDVAVKVLPAALAADADRLRRFEQEALSTAALNHPNILAVFDVGRDGDTAYVVEELLDGETLREKLAGTLPVRKVIDLATQIANGLAAAHEKGIVHRDVKPENLFVTRDERVKILDFGLAKTMVPAAAAATSTGLAGATEPGVLLGTVGYMAPEQVRGQPVDHRADIFSLGAVLYEMLSGRRAFAGDTTADTMTAILKEAPPDVSEGGRVIAPALERVVSRCLEKSPSARFQSASDLAFALQSLSTDSRSGTRLLPAAERSRVGVRRLIPLAAALAIGALAGIAAIALWQTSAEVRPAEPLRFSVSTADGIAIDDLTRASVSPDGRYLALTEPAASGRRLVILSLRDGSRRDVSDLNTTGSLCWSPDSQWLAYYGADRVLYKVAVSGLQRQRLAALDWAPITGSWSTTGEIVLVAGLTSTVIAVSSNGGAPRSVLPPADAASPWSSAQVLPDGNRLLLTRGHGPRSEMLLATLDGSEPPRAIGQGAFAQFVEPDYLLALRDNQIVVWRTTLENGVVGAEPAMLADGVLVRLGVAMMPFSSSASGLLVFRTEAQETHTRMAWFDRTGRETGALALPGHCRNPELSPGFDRLAMECWASAGGRDVWVYDLARDSATRLTSDPADDADPVWTPDGRTIVFASSRLGAVDVFQTGAGGGRPEELVANTPAATPTMGISPDGTQLILLTSGLDTASSLDLAILRLGGDGALMPMLKGSASEIEGQFSPDGKHFAYASNQSGHYDVYVEPWPQTGERWTISTEGGTDARWRPDGQEILYLAPDRRLMAVPVRTAGGFSAGRPVALFSTRVAGPLGTGHRFPFAVDKDGQRVLMYVTDPDSPPPAVTVISNWQGLLNRR
jgi:Tol biopolymer transport system component